MRIWGRSSRQHWAQMQPCSCGSHWHLIISPRLSPNQRLLACLLYSHPGSHRRSPCSPQGQACRSACVLSLSWAGPGFREQSGRHQSSNPTPAFWRLGPRLASREQGGKSTRFGVTGPAFQSWLGHRLCDREWLYLPGDIESKVLNLAAGSSVSSSLKWEQLQLHHGVAMSLQGGNRHV